jgi:2-polyprenyl-3-methyl-5-hydroxy-6-metoxy-1,4-benzoquinol methylase
MTMDVETYASRFRQMGDEVVPAVLASVLAAQPTWRVLDVGCGEGLLLDALEGRGDGLDLSETRASVARGRGHRVDVGDAGQIPHADGSYDVVSCRHVIEHVEDDVRCMRELGRVARHAVFVETPLRLQGAWYPYRCNGRWVLDPTHVREYGSVEELEAVGARAGLRLEVVHLVPVAYSLGHVLARVTRSDRPLHVGGNLRVPRYRNMHALFLPN